MGKPYVVTSSCRVVKKTDKAILVAFGSEDGPQEEWIPFSQIDFGESFDGSDPDDIDEGTEGVITVTAWIAKQKDLPVQE